MEVHGGADRGRLAHLPGHSRLRAGRPGPAVDRDQRWRQVHPSHVSQYGPEAATIGPPAGHPVLDTEP